MLDRLTSREFLVGVGLFALLILGFERGYELSEEIKAAIILGMIGGAAWRIHTKNGGTKDE